MKKQRLQNVNKKSTWFSDLHMLCHIYNNRKLFINSKTKSIHFMIAVNQFIWIEEVGTVSILLSTKRVKLHNVALLAPDCDLNLILFSQLRKSGITYYDNLKAITLMRNKKNYCLYQKKPNLFTFNLVQPGKTMVMTGHRQITHFIS